MKILLPLLILTVFSIDAAGQDKKLSADSDTIFWYKTYQHIRNQIGLEKTEGVDSNYYFRFWDGSKVIELKRNGKLTGTVTFLIQQYKENREGRIYFKKYQLTDSTTQAIHNLVTKYDVTGLPTDNQIEGWNGGFDGITYIIEHSDNDSWSFKNYWTPTIYKDQIPQAKQLADYVDSLNKVKEINEIGVKFMKRQPFSRWYNFIGSATIVMKK